jgi:anti-sigma regulatory factor (Ser/Thr protein kinase)
LSKNREIDEFSHQALFYRGESEYLDGVVRFMRPGMDAGEPVIAAVPGPRLDLLREGLDGDAGRVQLIDMADLGRNPARIIPAVSDMLQAYAGRRVHYVGEPIWVGRSTEEMCEAVRHEALINLAWSDTLMRVLCPYDAQGLDKNVLADAKRTHPTLVDGGGERASSDFMGHALPDSCERPLAEPPPEAITLPFGRLDLAQLRALVSQQALAVHLRYDQAADLVLAVNEVATNSVRHAGGHGKLRVWRKGDELICEVRDDGHIADPLAGRLRPDPAAPAGRGLWMVNQLCDLVEMRTNGGGTTVRLHAARR